MNKKDKNLSYKDLLYVIVVVAVGAFMILKVPELFRQLFYRR